MSNFTWRTLRVFTGGLLCSLPILTSTHAADVPPADPTTAAAAAAAEAQQAKEDHDAIQAYLDKEHPKVRNALPGRVNSAALRTAFPGYRFYVIKMRYPRGIPMPQEQLDSEIDLALSFDAKGKLDPRMDAKAMNLGLMKITNDEEAKTAAAAIMSLLIGNSGAQKIEATQVIVETKEKVRTCTAQAARLVYKVIFDAAGQCTHANLQDNSPPPP